MGVGDSLGFQVVEQAQPAGSHKGGEGLTAGSQSEHCPGGGIWVRCAAETGDAAIRLLLGTQVFDRAGKRVSLRRGRLYQAKQPRQQQGCDSKWY
jgi:hypothetical protein